MLNQDNMEARFAWYEAIIAKLAAGIVELEAKLNINSSNSNQPPSADSPFVKEPKKNTPKKRKGHKGVRQQMLVPTKVVECMPTPCSCGCSTVTEPTEYYRHQYIETPEPRLDITHFVLLQGKCLTCGTMIKGQIPHEFRAGFGPRIHALITELVGIHGNMSRIRATTFGVHLQLVYQPRCDSKVPITHICCHFAPL